MTDDELLAGAHANLAMWGRVFAEHNDGRTGTEAGLFMSSAPFEYAGFRTALVVGQIEPDAIARARAFFARDPEAFVIMARAKDVAHLRGDGVIELFQPPQMACTERVAEPTVTDDVTLSISTDRDDLRGYAVVTGAAFAELNFPAEQTTASLDRPSLLDDQRVALGVAKIDGRVVAGAITVTENGGSYVSFVAADAAARKRGLGDAVTRLVTNAGFDRGARFASLEASPFGYGVYERMGFREIRKYALLVVL
jgi:ribosomal protein S18 acetylase RimI-like enzyme